MASGPVFSAEGGGSVHTSLPVEPGSAIHPSCVSRDGTRCAPHVWSRPAPYLALPGSALSIRSVSARLALESARPLCLSQKKKEIYIITRRVARSEEGVTCVCQLPARREPPAKIPDSHSVSLESGSGARARLVRSIEHGLVVSVHPRVRDRRGADCGVQYTTGSGRVAYTLWRTSWGSYRARN